MQRLHDLKQARAQIAREARDLVMTADRENRAMTAEEAEKFAGLETKVNEHNDRIEQLEQVAKWETIVEKTGGGFTGADRSGPILPHNDPANKRHNYSVQRAYQMLLAGRAFDGLEGETHAELLTHRASRQARGILVPWDLRSPASSWTPELLKRAGISLETRVLNTTAGTGSIPTILGLDLIHLLRARLFLSILGARFMTGMQGLFALPRQSAAATSQWVAEGSAPTGSNQTIDQVAFSPKTLAGFTDYTRRFLMETNQDAEEFVRDDLVAITARGIELGAINGSGSGSNQPLGILQNSAITQVVSSGTNGGPPTFTNCVALKAQLAESNADMGSLGFLTNPNLRGTMETTLKVSGSNFPVYLWNDESDRPLAGMPAAVSTQVPNNLSKGTSSGILSALIYGNWSDLVVAMWSGVDVLIDPYTGSSSGTVRVVALQDADVNVRHPQSFAYSDDVQTTM